MVAAHPDDIDFGAAGTVATWTAAGVDVRYCLCTSGEAGGKAGVSADRIRAEREAEQRAAAAEVGVKEIAFLRHPDGLLTASLGLRRDLAREIRRVRPDVVIGPSPEVNWDRIQVSHPDHRAAGESVLAAVYPDARNPRAFPELLDAGFAPWTVRELWLNTGPFERINHVVDITDVFPAKLAALHAHPSQVAGFRDLDAVMRRAGATVAAAHGLPEDRLAEGFQIVATS